MQAQMAQQQELEYQQLQERLRSKSRLQRRGEGIDAGDIDSFDVGQVQTWAQAPHHRFVRGQSIPAANNMANTHQPAAQGQPLGAPVAIAVPAYAPHPQTHHGQHSHWQTGGDGGTYVPEGSGHP